MIASILHVLTLLILIYINNDYTMEQIGWYSVLPYTVRGGHRCSRVPIISLL